MIVSPDRNDFYTIANILGRLAIGIGFFMLIPAGVAFFNAEYKGFIDFLIAFFASESLGLALVTFCPSRQELTWMHSFFIVSLGWLLAAFLGAIPLYLSGHWRSFLDAYFEAMSGFATTGLTLVRDLDHLGRGCNMWRHLMMFIGGQGVIVVALSILTKAGQAALGLYFGEARSEKILPNIISTARFIWLVSFVYLVIGSGVLYVILLSQGLNPAKAIYHSIWLFMAAFDTGGFAPQAQNIAYYHSHVLEIATLVLMLLGALNFNLHYWLWNKSRKEIFKNFEVRTFLFSFFGILIFLFFALKLNASSLFHKGLYQLISAHSGCGFTNLAPFELNSWPPIALILVILAMGIGGGIGSTTGGFKLMRLGIIFKAVATEVKRWMMPPKAVYSTQYHHLNDIVLDNKKIKEVFVVFFLFCAVYLIGGLVGMFLGYPPIASFFESVSATANVGLSLGITNPHMPAVLKLTYIGQMWAGRLEFLSVFVSLGFLLSLVRR